VDVDVLLCRYVRPIVYSAVAVVVFFFFFSSRRRHTRLVSDWSSDVCSSDLRTPAWVRVECAGKAACMPRGRRAILLAALARGARSEERRVGKEWRSRWSPYQ